MIIIIVIVVVVIIFIKSCQNAAYTHGNIAHLLTAAVGHRLSWLSMITVDRPIWRPTVSVWFNLICRTGLSIVPVVPWEGPGPPSQGAPPIRCQIFTTLF